MRPASFLALLLLGACADRLPGWAQPPAGAVAGDGTVSGDPAAVRRLAAPPVIDGKLDEPLWADAAALGPFVDPGNGEARPGSPVAAWARVAWDERALYLGVVVRDPEPAAPFPRDAVDPRIWQRSSAIELMLQPGDPGDNREYFEIQVDAGGAVFDTRWPDYNRPIRGEAAARVFGEESWSSQVERAVHIGSGFYSVEIALPFAALAPARVALPPRPGDVWRLDLYSFKEGQRRSLAWSPIRGQGNFHRSSRFGRIVFR